MRRTAEGCAAPKVCLGKRTGAAEYHVARRRLAHCPFGSIAGSRTAFPLGRPAADLRQVRNPECRFGGYRRCRGWRGSGGFWIPRCSRAGNGERECQGHVAVAHRWRKHATRRTHNARLGD